MFLLLWAGIGVDDDPGDLILYFDYANHVDDGHVPYRDFQLEYPPLALVPILLAFYPSNAVGGFFNGFEFLFALETYLLALASGLLAWSIMDRVLPTLRERERRWRMVAYVAAYPLIGQIVTTRLDLLPTALTVGAIALWLRRTERAEYSAWLLLAAGVAVKLSPIVVAPIFALDACRRRSLRCAVLGGLAFLGGITLFFVPGYLASPDGFIGVFTYHSARGIQIESIYANLTLWWSRVADFDVDVIHAFGAFEASSVATPAIRTVSTLLQLGTLASVYLTFLLATWRDALALRRDRLLVLGSLLALAAFIAFGKVFSPQYLIWLIPLVVLVPGRLGRWAIGVFLLTLVWTQVLFPYAYIALLDNTVAGLVVLTYRNVLFLALFVILMLAFARQARGPAPVT